MIRQPFLAFCLAFLLGILLFASENTARLLDGRPDNFEIRKRVDLNTLYNAVPNANKVPLGNAQHFGLDLTKSATYTTAYFYGCTIVISVDGKSVTIGHFAQENARPGTNDMCIAMTDRKLVEKKILDPLENAHVMTDFTDDTRAWIVTSSGPGTVGYKRISQYFTDSGLPAKNVIPVSYIATTMFTNFDSGPVGKAVVEIVPQSGGGATINVYIQSDTPSWSGTYDAGGNLVSAPN